MLKRTKIALVHDELIRRGGAEAVFEELLQMYPNADVYALYAGNSPRIILDGHIWQIHTSYIQHLPLWFRKHPGRVLPLLPQAAEQLDLSAYDFVISSSSGFAKGVVTRSTIPHICYCHTPTRYLWDSTHDAIKKAPYGARWLLRIFIHFLRMSDFAAAQRPDFYIANSRYTQQRIMSYYRRESEVVYPPVDTSFFCPNHSERRRNFFLTVGRLTPTKHFDQAITVCEKLRIPLVVVGTGHDLNRLKKHARRHTTFTGKISREQLRTYYRTARALLQPGTEDFGISTVEALSCGTPVIAYGDGGVREIINKHAYGVLYDAPQQEALADAIRQFNEREDTFIAAELQKRAMKFSTNRFRGEIKAIVEKALEKRNTCK